MVEHQEAITVHRMVPNHRLHLHHHHQKSSQLRGLLAMPEHNFKPGSQPERPLIGRTTEQKGYNGTPAASSKKPPASPAPPPPKATPKS